MNAQESWKYQYRLFKSFRALSTEFEWNRDDMRHYRREAALERALEAERRKSESLKRQRDMYEGALEYACKDVIALKRDNDNLKHGIAYPPRARKSEAKTRYGR